jgi:hypothetical protein
MKTKNNVQKAVRKSLGVITCLILIIFSIDAQDVSIRDREIFSEVMSSTMLNGNSSFRITLNNYAKINSIPAYIIDEAEDELKLEDWMMNDEYFYADNNLTKTNSEIESTEMSSLKDAPEIEKELELEEWMLDERNFNVKSENETNPDYPEINYSLQKQLK